MTVGTLRLQDNECLIKPLVPAFLQQICIVLVAEVHDNVNNPKYAVENVL